MASKSATLSAVMKSTNNDASVNELIEILLDTTQKDQQISQLEKKDASNDHQSQCFGAIRI